MWIDRQSHVRECGCVPFHVFHGTADFQAIVLVSMKCIEAMSGLPGTPSDGAGDMVLDWVERSATVCRRIQLLGAVVAVSKPSEEILEKTT